MRLTRNEVKISFNTIEFAVDEKKQRVKCRLHFDVKLPKDLDNEVFFSEVSKKFVDSVAVCHSGDVFDEQLGKKIALAKAEILAYRRIARSLKRAKVIVGPKDVYVVMSTRKIVKDFNEKAKRCIKHNMIYIEQIAGKE